MNVDEIVKGMRLEVELVDGTVLTVPVSFDFSSLTVDDSKKAFELGGGSPGRVTAAFVAFKANQTMNLGDDDLLEVVEVLEALMDGDETNLVIEDGPDGGTSAVVSSPDLSPSGSEAMTYR